MMLNITVHGLRKWEISLERYFYSWHVFKKWIIQARTKMRNDNYKKNMKFEMKKNIIGISQVIFINWKKQMKPIF